MTSEQHGRLKSLISLFCVTLAFAVSAKPSPLAFRVDPTKPEDTAGLASAGNRTDVSITSQRGIGGATLVKLGDVWPSLIVLNLNLKGLESIAMDNGSIRFEASARAKMNVPYYSSGSGPNATQAGVLNVGIEKKDQFIEVRIPNEMLEGNPDHIRISWIDFYR